MREEEEKWEREEKERLEKELKEKQAKEEDAKFRKESYETICSIAEEWLKQINSWYDKYFIEDFITPFET